jgi:putative copper export protein
MTDTAATNRRHAVVWPLLAGVGVLAGCTAAGIAALSLAAALTATGLPDAGSVTTLGLPFLRAAAEVAAVLAVGSFLFAAFLVPPQSSGVLDVDGYWALRLGSVASGVWAVSAALLVPLTISDVSGQPLTTHRNPVTIWSLASLINTATAWRWTALLAAAVMLASLPVLRWSWTPLLLMGSLVTLVPLGLTGHSSAGGSHDLGTNGLLIHLVAAGLWSGGLLALLAHAIRGGEHADLAARRFSAMASWCFVAMALSGLVNALMRVSPSDLLTTDYGRLVVAKFVALCLLGVVGWRQRRTGVAALQVVPGARKRLIRLALIEAAVFGVTFGIAVGLGRTPPPPPSTVNPSIPEVAIGYTFAGPLTPARVLFDWRFDLIFGTTALVVAAVYLTAVLRLRRRGDAWPPSRTISWLLGCLALLLATSSGVGRYMPAMFSVHMAAHMLLSMLVPVLMVLGAPVSLALRALPTAGRGEPAGYAGMAAGRPAQPGVPVPDQPRRRHRVVHRRVLWALLRRHIRRCGGQPCRPYCDERAFSGQRLPVLLGGVWRGPSTPADPAAGEAGCSLRVVAAARFLRRGADGHSKGAWRTLLPVTAPELAHRPAG